MEEKYFETEVWEDVFDDDVFYEQRKLEELLGEVVGIALDVLREEDAEALIDALEEEFDVELYG